MTPTDAKQMTPEQAAVKVDELLRAFEEACEHLGAHMLRGRVPTHEIEERARLRGDLRARLLSVALPHPEPATND